MPSAPPAPPHVARTTVMSTSRGTVTYHEHPDDDLYDGDSDNSERPHNRRPLNDLTTEWRSLFRNLDALEANNSLGIQQARSARQSLQELIRTYPTHSVTEQAATEQTPLLRFRSPSWISDDSDDLAGWEYRRRRWDARSPTQLYRRDAPFFISFAGDFHLPSGSDWDPDMEDGDTLADAVGPGCFSPSDLIIGMIFVVLVTGGICVPVGFWIDAMLR